MTSDDRHTIVLCGMKGSGKTHFGRILQQRGLSFIDSDEAMLAASNEALGIGHLYRTLKAPGFRELEYETLKRIISKAEAESETRFCISTGGGLADNIPAMNLIAKFSSRKIYLKQKSDILFQRACANGIPAYLSQINPERQFLVIAEQRNKVYSSFCDYVIQLYDYRNDEDIVSKLTSILDS
ncbi:MAG: shikimate kinase [Sphaerochaetaceae bacterium]|jgi:shikimate kinase|nr:shikimate kinase [Sphaerochaetaceae bacterium]NLY06985.1 hypothetical protein [Spirochaetales bacterium]